MKKSDKHHFQAIISLLIKSGIGILICLLEIVAVGVKAQAVQKVPSHKPTVLRVKQIYTSQIGIREKHSNSGAEVEKYLRYVNLPKGNPWCAAFVCWVFGQANVENPRTGWSPELFKRNRIIWERASIGALHKPVFLNDETNTYPHSLNYQPIRPARQQTTDNRQQVKDNRQPGTADIFGIYFPDKKRIAHVGFIDQWLGDWLITVEGNTNDPGAREGDGVYRKRRAVKSIYQVARYIPQP